MIHFSVQSVISDVTFLCHLVLCWIQELNAFSPPVNVFQIHVHCYLHFRVSYKDICKRILFSAVLLFEGSVELAGLHCHCHGVSNGVSGTFVSHRHQDSCVVLSSVLGAKVTFRARLFENQHPQYFFCHVKLMFSRPHTPGWWACCRGQRSLSYHCLIRPPGSKTFAVLDNSKTKPR